jgi:hypothetical protein
MSIPEQAPPFESVSREECSIELDEPDLYIQYDGWEYFLSEENGPSHPPLDLDDVVTELRLYGDDAVVFHEIPERDKDFEVCFGIRNAYRIDEDGNRIDS